MLVFLLVASFVLLFLHWLVDPCSMPAWTCKRICFHVTVMGEYVCVYVYVCVCVCARARVCVCVRARVRV